MKRFFTHTILALTCSGALAQSPVASIPNQTLGKY